jgi:hypothetical protein
VLFPLVLRVAQSKYTSLRWKQCRPDLRSLKLGLRFNILIHVPCIFIVSYYDQQKAQLQLVYKLSRSYLFRHYRVIFRELLFITSPSYIIISIAAVGNTI